MWSYRAFAFGSCLAPTQNVKAFFFFLPPPGGRGWFIISAAVAKRLRVSEPGGPGRSALTKGSAPSRSLFRPNKK